MPEIVPYHLVWDFIFTWEAGHRILEDGSEGKNGVEHVRIWEYKICWHMKRKDNYDGTGFRDLGMLEHGI